MRRCVQRECIAENHSRNDALRKVTWSVYYYFSSSSSRLCLSHFCQLFSVLVFEVMSVRVRACVSASAQVCVTIVSRVRVREREICASNSINSIEEFRTKFKSELGFFVIHSRPRGSRIFFHYFQCFLRRITILFRIKDAERFRSRYSLSSCSTLV